MGKQKNHISRGVWWIGAFVLVSACRQDIPVHERPVIPQPASTFIEPMRRDLDDIRASGKLTALTLNNSTSYFVYRGQAMGYEYELLSLFANDIGVDLEIKVVPDTRTMFDLLNEGKGDVIACNLAITSERRKMAKFSNPYNLTKQVLVQRLPEGHENMSQAELNQHLVMGPLGLAGKRIHVSKDSPYLRRLRNLRDETGSSFEVVAVSTEVGTEKLIKQVADGIIEFTVSDDNIARINTTYYDNLDISVQLSFPQQIAWATRKNAPELLGAINEWFDANRHTSNYAYIYNKYFKAPKSRWSQLYGEYSSIHGDRISPYDDILKEYAGLIDWDWRLLAAQMYQESKFQVNARSWAGAFGLMQFMPATAEQYGIDSSSSPEAHIRAAILYLRWLDDYWQKRIFDPEERIRFVLAAYNAGLGHVIDATNLAASLGYDPFRWEGNVAECMLLKSKPEYYTMHEVKHGYCRGREPYDYVKKILHQYDHYRSVIQDT